MIKLDIFSDPICPWCYIGKSNLDRALESRPDHPFEIEWHPFQLNPDMAPAGRDLGDYIAERFGGKTKAVQMFAHVEKSAAEMGVEIDFTRVRRVPNTLNAHRMVFWAGLEGKQTAMVSALFRAYWRDEADIGDPATLAALAGKIGLDATAMERLLASDADKDAILSRDAHARQRGVTGVPCFVVANQYVLSGAQPVSLWQQAMDELIAAQKGTA